MYIPLIYFYKKIFFPAIFMSIFLTIIGSMLFSHNPALVGVSYLFCSLAMHFVAYEVRGNHEYYFYNNMGYSRLALWGVTIVLGLLALIISIIAYAI